ncbi:MAG: RES family NAD+ phosphorylase [Polyangiaceae bacterium]
MSRSIWTQCAAKFSFRALAFDAWRVVESQHITSTRKLVDSDSEQALLEELVDRVKPPAPAGKKFASLHYLLFTPFRHPPLRHGSRFGTVTEPGIWYGSKDERTAFAEVAYYRLLFLDGTKADIEPITVELTAFAAAVATKKGADLTRLPFLHYKRALTSKTSYDATHVVGHDMREAGVEVFLFTSARAPGDGVNVGLFAPAFAKKSPKNVETWICTAARKKVELVEKIFPGAPARRFAFAREEFEVKGALPAPGT